MLAYRRGRLTTLGHIDRTPGCGGGASLLKSCMPVCRQLHPDSDFFVASEAGSAADTGGIGRSVRILMQFLVTTTTDCPLCIAEARCRLQTVTAVSTAVPFSAATSRRRHRHRLPSAAVPIPSRRCCVAAVPFPSRRCCVAAVPIPSPPLLCRRRRMPKVRHARAHCGTAFESAAGYRGAAGSLAGTTARQSAAPPAVSRCRGDRVLVAFPT